MTQASGELYDLGYQHYQGPREGRMRARKAVFVDGFRTTLGLGHGPLAKVLPILLFGAAMVPAIIMAIIASQTQGLLDLPDHADYYRIVSIILITFSAIIAPELLCPDRRNGVISLYLVRPLTITDYVVGRWLAFFTITLLLVYSGQIVLLAGLILSAADPWEYIRRKLAGHSSHTRRWSLGRNLFYHTAVGGICVYEPARLCRSVRYWVVYHLIPGGGYPHRVQRKRRAADDGARKAQGNVSLSLGIQQSGLLWWTWRVSPPT